MKTQINRHYMAILMSAFAMLALISCTTTQPGTIDQKQQKIDQTRNIAYSLSITALNTLWFISREDQTEWDGIVRTIRNDVYPAIVMANGGSMALAPALGMAKDKAPDKMDGLLASLEAIVGNSRPALDGVQAAMSDWLKANP